MRSAAPLQIGPLQELLEYDPFFETTLPALLGLPYVEDNIAEGIVIKPLEPRFLSNGSRVIIKKKNERFAEITGTKKISKPKNQPLPSTSLAGGSPLYGELVEDLKRYMNQNRLDAVISKIGTVTSRDLPRLKGLLARDALEDFEKLSEDYEKLGDEEKGRLKRYAPYLAQPIVEDYFHTKS